MWFRVPGEHGQGGGELVMGRGVRRLGRVWVFAREGREAAEESEGGLLTSNGRKNKLARAETSQKLLFHKEGEPQIPKQPASVLSG